MKISSQKAVYLVIMVFLLLVSACGSNEKDETVSSAEDMVTYSITVLDQNDLPVDGAIVQMCKDQCFPGATNEEGVVKFSLPKDAYKVSFISLPEGYAYVDDAREFYFEEGSAEMVIVLETVLQ